MTEPSPVPVVDIDLDALAANYRFIQGAVAPAECAAVVKCDGYGLGALPLARSLADEGCRRFFATYAGEGAALRAVLGAGCAIYVFNGVEPATAQEVRDAGFIPVLNSLAQARLWKLTAPTAPAALHIDTGMNRLGLPAAEAQEAARLGLVFETVMSHLASPSPEGNPANERQRAAFEHAAALFPGARRSLSASGGALMAKRFHYDLVRPGIALYGASPFDAPDARLKPVARLTAPVIQMRDIRAGDTVGYGATFTAAAPMRLATVALGYGDGFPRAASNRGAALLGGGLCPIVGRVSMDLIVLDATAAPRDISVGDRAEFFGPRLPVEQAAEGAGTLAYELFTGLGRRIIRRYWRNGRMTGEAAS